jgi:preprotein translocase SecE subunit
MIFFAVRYLLSAKGEEAMIATEEGGWMSFHSYKRTQGLKVRRYTMIGALLIGLSGVFSIYTHESFGTGVYKLPMPFGITAPVITTSANIVIPGLLGLTVLWLSWRMVNMPTFADFLIATEAEMNKVSWTSRKRLVQDTIVVLTTMFLMTAFLFFVDLFWGWLLSLKFIGVLPPTKEGQHRDKQTLSY